MMLLAAIDLLRSSSLDVLGMLARASIEGGLLAALVWVICRTLPSLPAGVRAWLWLLVSLKLLLGVLPLPGVPVAWLPSGMALVPTPAVVGVAPEPAATFPLPLAPPPAPAHERVERTATPASSATIAIPYVTLWPVALALTWLAIVGARVGGLVRAYRAARRLVRHAEPVPTVIARRVVRLVHRFALPVVPDVLASRLSDVPLLVGVLRPSILLPADSTGTLSRNELDLVVAHELAHVRRGDLLWGWIPAIAARLFFFHPLARFAAREYLAAREEACDVEVLQTLDAEPAEYGRLLVKLGVAPIDHVLTAAGTSPTFESLKRRLIMLDRSRTPASRWWWALAGTTAMLVPLTLVASQEQEPRASSGASLGSGVAGGIGGGVAGGIPGGISGGVEPGVAQGVPGLEVDQQPPEPPPAPAAPPAPPVPPVEHVVSAPPAPPAPPVPPAAPVAPVERVREPSDRHRPTSPWVLLEPGSKNVMAGSSEDRADAERIRTSENDTLLWFRYQGKAYVTRDAATIAAVRQAFEPVGVMGKKMGAVGAKQGALGAEQGKLGAKQGELGAAQAAIAAKIARIAADRQAVHAGRVRTQRDGSATATDAAEKERTSSERELEARREELNRQIRELVEQQRALGEQMRALGDRMREDGDVLKRMGQQLQEEIVAADGRATSIFGAAVASGAATKAR